LGNFASFLNNKAKKILLLLRHYARENGKQITMLPGRFRRKHLARTCHTTMILGGFIRELSQSRLSPECLAARRTAPLNSAPGFYLATNCQYFVFNIIDKQMNAPI
jgi:hypothetical protein